MCASIQSLATRQSSAPDLRGINDGPWRLMLKSQSSECSRAAVLEEITMDEATAEMIPDVIVLGD